MMASTVHGGVDVGLAAAVGVLLLALATRTRAVQRLDDRIESAAGARRTALVPFAAIGTLPGEPYMHWLIGAASAATIVALRGGSPLRVIVPAALASLGAICAHHAVKLVYRRPRPAVALGKGKTEPAFPSGHTADATAALLTGAFLLASQAIAPPALLWTVAATLAIVTGVSRVALGWHWASDVLGGWLTGIAVAAFAAVAYEWLG